MIARTVQVAVSDDHVALVTLCPNLMRRSTPPDSEAVARTYSRIDEPSAKDRSPSHGRNGYPKVYMSLSDRIPGYRNRSHVPPIASRPSRIV